MDVQNLDRRGSFSVIDHGLDVELHLYGSLTLEVVGVLEGGSQAAPEPAPRKDER
jgi:hypothetical protein